MKAFMWAMILALLLGTRAGNVCAQDHLGSVNDYVISNPDFAEADEFPLLGIAVINGGSTLHGGQQFEGAEIVGVAPGSPAAIAGLRGRHQRVQMLITATALVSSMLFPPAMLVALALGSSGVGESHEFIIAVDGIRVHDIMEMGGALNQGQPGEIVYLTVISNGERKQIRIPLRCRSSRNCPVYDPG